jgi:hypothetical protein
MYVLTADMVSNNSTEADSTLEATSTTSWSTAATATTTKAAVAITTAAGATSASPRAKPTKAAAELPTELIETLIERLIDKLLQRTEIDTSLKNILGREAARANDSFPISKLVCRESGNEDQLANLLRLHFSVDAIQVKVGLFFWARILAFGPGLFRAFKIINRA